jgi:hypothetical protein
MNSFPPNEPHEPSIATGNASDAKPYPMTTPNETHLRAAKAVPLFSKIDEDLSKHKWRRSSCGRYFLRAALGVGVRNVRISAHREVLARMLGRKLNRNEYADHINSDGADNRRENIRLTDSFGNSQNINNRPFRGAFWDKRRGAWLAIVRHKGKQHYCGAFESRRLAADAAAKKRSDLGFLSSNAAMSKEAGRE